MAEELICELNFNSALDRAKEEKKYWEEYKMLLMWIIFFSILSVLIVSYFYIIRNMYSVVKNYYLKRKASSVIPKTINME